jgi:heme/copper-type cytochrome/quinol oxidase subunit 4
MSELFAEKQTRRALVVWLVLVAATIVSWTVGVNHGIDYRVSTVLVLVFTFVKVNLVGMNFMELREAVLPLRAIFNAFCIVVCVGLIGMYLTNI